MKFGAKTFDNGDFLDYLAGAADFFEIQAIRGNDYSFLDKYIGEVPIVIHAEHIRWGTNPADSTLSDLNLESVNFAIELANKVKAKKIIVHAGVLMNENCSVENSIDFFKRIDDSRIHIENVPYNASGVNGGGICYGLKDTDYFLKRTGLKFCFDINHAVETALTLKSPPYDLIQGFEEMHPSHYHLSGEDMEKGKSHISFLDSDLDLNKVLEIISSKAEVTLEVTLDKKRTLEDLEIVRRLTV